VPRTVDPGERGDVLRLVNPVEDATWPRASAERRSAARKTGKTAKRRASGKE